MSALIFFNRMHKFQLASIIATLFSLEPGDDS